jgi:hypothetical protein
VRAPIPGNVDVVDSQHEGHWIRPFIEITSVLRKIARIGVSEFPTGRASMLKRYGLRASRRIFSTRADVMLRVSWMLGCAWRVRGEDGPAALGAPVTTTLEADGQRRSAPRSIAYLALDPIMLVQSRADGPARPAGLDAAPRLGPFGVDDQTPGRSVPASNLDAVELPGVANLRHCQSRQKQDDGADPT